MASRMRTNNHPIVPPFAGSVGEKPTSSSPMTKIPSIAFLTVGILLLVYGLNASNSFSSSVSQAVSGSPTDKSIWLIVLGIVGILSGGFGLFFRKAP
jgi:LPXTG-motif cell wall-anchored protein